MCSPDRDEGSLQRELQPRMLLCPGRESQGIGAELNQHGRPALAPDGRLAPTPGCVQTGAAPPHPLQLREDEQQLSQAWLGPFLPQPGFLSLWPYHSCPSRGMAYHVLLQHITVLNGTVQFLQSVVSSL